MNSNPVWRRRDPFDHKVFSSGEHLTADLVGPDRSSSVTDRKAGGRDQPLARRPASKSRAPIRTRTWIASSTPAAGFPPGAAPMTIEMRRPTRSPATARAVSRGRLRKSVARPFAVASGRGSGPKRRSAAGAGSTGWRSGAVCPAAHSVARWRRRTACSRIHVPCPEAAARACRTFRSSAAPKWKPIQSAATSSPGIAAPSSIAASGP